MIQSQLNQCKEWVESALVESIQGLGPKTILRDAMEYALMNGGKRFRPAIVYLVAAALGKKHEVKEAALAIEYFHTASLIADDLPCMDNDDERRDKPSLHKVYGEATALLASYALISAGYLLIRQGAQRLESSEVCALAVENASYNTGILGAAGGQYEDLHMSQIDDAKLLEMIDKKTGALFEISFVFGWLYGGGETHQLEVVKQAARSFGRAFQISDDFLDLQQDEGKLNYPALVGADKAHSLLSQELKNYYTLLEKLSLNTSELTDLGKLIVD